MAKIFLSHSSKDKPVVDLFKTLLLNVGLGVDDKDIAYTSAVETGVPLGSSIPQFIKSNIDDSEFVFLFISENYRDSEVCLNEMGAAWALDKNVKPLLIHDNVPFESVGWLYHMNLCARLSDSDMLDELRDEILEKFPYRSKTAVWNRQKVEFLSRLNQLADDKDTIDLKDVSHLEDTEELGLLDYREMFDEHNAEFINITGRITDASNTLASNLKQRTKQLNTAAKGALSTQQAKGIMIAIARDYDKFSAVIEENTPLASEKFNAFIDSTKMLQNHSMVSEEIKTSNRQGSQYLFDQLIKAQKSVAKLRETVSGISDIEKSLIKAKKRTLKAMDFLIQAMDNWISRTSELLRL